MIIEMRLIKPAAFFNVNALAPQHNAVNYPKTNI